MAGRRARPRGALASLLCAISLLVMSSAGCGAEVTGQPAPGGPSAAPSSSPASSDPASTALTIVVDDGAGGVTTWTLTCDPVGGDHPDAEAACRALAQNGARALPPVPRGRMCTQVFAGPETATVTGTWNGKAVDSRFNRRNGCEIARWKALAGLLPAAANR